MTAGLAPLLDMRDVCVEFRVSGGWAPAVKTADLMVRAGETLAIVGESGCGKSSLALAMMGLIPDRVGRVRGSIRFDGRNLLDLPEPALSGIRGRDIGMIFQEPMTSLNPLLRVGDQVAEAILRHEAVTRAQARDRVVRLFERVGIPDAAHRLAHYPHQLSGGLRQRVMIAMALACGPRLLVADEPTTALDVTIQAQVLALISDLQRETGMGVVLITHDLGVVATVATHVLVMYAGRVVEYAPVQELFEDPSHPYTRALLNCVPDLSEPYANLGRRMAEIAGSVESFAEGCAYRSRCPLVFERCAIERPVLGERGNGRQAACFKARS